MAKTNVCVEGDAALIKELEAFLAKPVLEGESRTIEQKVATLHASDLLALLKSREVTSEVLTANTTS